MKTALHTSGRRVLLAAPPLAALLIGGGLHVGDATAADPAPRTGLVPLEDVVPRKELRNEIARVIDYAGK